MGMEGKISEDKPWKMSFPLTHGPSDWHLFPRCWGCVNYWHSYWSAVAEHWVTRKRERKYQSRTDSLQSTCMQLFLLFPACVDTALLQRSMSFPRQSAKWSKMSRKVEGFAQWGLEQWFWNVASTPAALASPGNLLNMRLLGPHPWPTESEIPGAGPRNLCG